MSSTIGTELGYPPVELTVGDSSFLCDNNTHVGVEIEVENIDYNLVKPTRYWTAKGDNSLRNNGLEFVFTTPLRGANVDKALEELAALFDSDDIEPDFSSRTSVHVHLDVRDLSQEEFKSFILTFLSIEPILYKWLPPSRSEGVFCVPLFSSFKALSACSDLINLDINKSSGKLANVASNFSKYLGLNVSAAIKFGSVEFRHMYGTYDLDILKQWIYFIVRLKQFAKENSDIWDNFPYHISMMGFDRFAKAIVPGQFLQAVPEYEELIVKGVRNAQFVLHKSKIATQKMTVHKVVRTPEGWIVVDEEVRGEL